MKKLAVKEFKRVHLSVCDGSNVVAAFIAQCVRNVISDAWSGANGGVIRRAVLVSYNFISIVLYNIYF